MYLTALPPQCIYVQLFEHQACAFSSKACASREMMLRPRLFPPSIRIVHGRERKSSPLHPHLLQMPDDGHVGIHVAVDAVLHTGVLVALQRAGSHAAGDALLEADGVELVDGCDGAVSMDACRRKPPMRRGEERLPRRNELVFVCKIGAHVLDWIWAFWVSPTTNWLSSCLSLALRFCRPCWVSAEI
jgi:hypothetical protein